MNRLKTLTTWKPFFRIFALQLLVLAVCLAILRVGLVPALLTLLLLTGVTAWLARSQLAPLLKLISVAIDPRADDDLEGLGASEWAELESALDRIQRDLRQKTDALSRERGELSTLMSALSDAILAVDTSGRPLFFNSRFALLFGARRGLSLEEMLRSSDVGAVFSQAVTSGEPRQRTLPLYAVNEESPRYFALSVSPLRRENGPVYGALGIFHDITELKRAEKIRIEFVANVSHELRTPLTVIKGYADTLKEDVAANRTDSIAASVDAISRNSQRLMDLIKDLLDLSSIENESEKNVSRQSVSTREMTSRVLEQLESRREQKGHRIETHFEVEQVSVNPSRMEQALLNLVENAIKYVPREGKISIRWERSGDQVQLSVSDNGPGIPRELHGRLFERFYRVDRARSQEIEGTGLGLSIVKHIIQRHGGSVSVQSEPGRGATFICRIPCPTPF